MTQLILPQTIDAGTPMVASEVQADFVAVRDVINGGIEGGSGASGNIKERGVTARELADNIKQNGNWFSHQAGVMNGGDLKVTPGAGLTLNYASGSAHILDDGGVVSLSSILVPVTIAAGSSVVVGANASGNPRIDQVILTLTGWQTATVSVLQGTPTGGATIANRNGAAALPSSAVRLADILVPNGFAGPFVQNTHIRDRRPWARGAFAALVGDGASGTTTASATPVQIAATAARLEITAGAQLEVTFQGFVSNSVAASIFFTLFQDGVEVGNTRAQSSSHAATNPHWFTYSFTVDPSDGSHEFSIAWWASGGGTATLVNASNVTFRATYKEIVRPNATNSGA